MRLSTEDTAAFIQGMQTSVEVESVMVDYHGPMELLGHSPHLRWPASL